MVKRRKGEQGIGNGEGACSMGIGRGTSTSGPRLSGLFDYPDFFLRSQSFHEY